MNKVLIKTLFSILIFLQIPNAHSHNDNNLDSLCTFSNIPLINKTIGCRKVTAEETNSLKVYWSNETNEDPNYLDEEEIKVFNSMISSSIKLADDSALIEAAERICWSQGIY